ncbi:hypothetical protein GCM10028862_11570 [Luteimonas pelagia]
MSARPDGEPPRGRRVAAALAALAALYVAWFGMRSDVVAIVVFALPPLLLAARTVARRGAGRAPFWAAVLSLGWFSHGVMVAWSRPAEALFALGAVALSLAVLFAVTLPALRARSRSRDAGRRGL